MRRNIRGHWVLLWLVAARRDARLSRIADSRFPMRPRSASPRIHPDDRWRFRLAAGGSQRAARRNPSDRISGQRDGRILGRSLDGVPSRPQGRRLVEGRNVAIEYRWAEGHNDRLPILASDLVQRQASVLVVLGGTASAPGAEGASTTIPVVFRVAVDPVEVRLVTSLNRPGGNVTGVTTMGADL